MSNDPASKETNLKGERRPNKSNKKRKREQHGKKLDRDREEYYGRLLHHAKKEIRKQIKVVKTFECQKIIRKLKTFSDENEKKRHSLEERMQMLKKNEVIEATMNESLRRLGILHLDPKLQLASVDQESDENTDALVSKATDAETSKLKMKPAIETLLQHKKMQTTIEKWNEEVTQYRRWCLQQQEKESGIKPENRTPAKKRKATPDIDAVSKQHDRSTFVCLGGDDASDDAETTNGGGALSHYGPASEGTEALKKKNRMGQRQRKAKALAIRAKQEGRLHRADQSMNWRIKKTATNEDTTPTANEVPTTPGRAQEDLHPSWQAAKKETAGIVKFEGKKITF